MNLHPDDEGYFEVIKEMSFRLAAKFDLDLEKVEYKKHPGRVVLGMCAPWTKHIKILIRTAKNGHWSAKRLPDHVIMKTVAHELAHLKFYDHGKEHDTLTDEIFNYVWFGQKTKEKQK